MISHKVLFSRERPEETREDIVHGGGTLYCVRKCYLFEIYWIVEYVLDKKKKYKHTNQNCIWSKRQTFFKFVVLEKDFSN